VQKDPPCPLQAYPEQPQIQISSRRIGLSPLDLHLSLKGLSRTLAVNTQGTLAAKLIAAPQPIGMSVPSRVAALVVRKRCIAYCLP
jgi:hypothetical protein